MIDAKYQEWWDKIRYLTRLKDSEVVPELKQILFELLIRIDTLQQQHDGLAKLHNNMVAKCINPMTNQAWGKE